MENRLLLSIAVLEREIQERKNFILSTVENINNSKILNYEVLIIIQEEKKELLGVSPFYNLINTKVIYSKIESVSHARNLGIEYAIKHNFTHIIISDSMVINDIGFFEDVEYCMEKDIELLQGKLLWTSDFTSKYKYRKIDFKEEKMDIFKNSYVGSFLFQVDNLLDIRFNENIGPASYTTIKSGEDILFLHSYIKKHGYITMNSINGYIYHPPRNKDLSKHLKYAKGQGALYRYFLSQNEKPRRYYLYLLLFWINGFLRVLLFRKNSIEILKNRACGFFMTKKDIEINYKK